MRCSEPVFLHRIGRYDATVVCAVGVLGSLAMHLTINGLVFLYIFGLCIAARLLIGVLWPWALMCGLLLGGWQVSRYEQFNTVYHNHQGSNVLIEGKVSTDPVYGFRGQLEANITNHRINDYPISGTARISAFHNDLRRGDLIQAQGKLRPGYGSRNGEMSFAEVKVLKRDRSVLSRWRSRFIAGIHSTINDPQASLGLGFLIGVRSLLPEKTTDQLSETGLTHIVAVSGYNLTIIIAYVRRILGSYSRRGSVVIAAGMLFAFIEVAGISASVGRASVVAMLSLAAWFYGRPISGTRLLVFSAALSAMWNPYYLWKDVGWYLSFLAFFGVLIVAPRVLKGREVSALTRLLVETTCAQIMTAPLIAHIFGEFSIVSLAANALVLPAVPLAMFVTFIVGVMSMIASIQVATYAAYLASLPLHYIVVIIDLLADLPGASASVSISRTTMIIVYSWILSVFWLAYYRVPIVAHLASALYLIMQTKRKSRSGRPL